MAQLGSGFYRCSSSSRSGSSPGEACEIASEVLKLRPDGLLVLKKQEAGFRLSTCAL